MFAVYRSRQVSALGLGQSLSRGGFLPQMGKVPVCVREEEESRGEAEEPLQTWQTEGHWKGTSSVRNRLSKKKSHSTELWMEKGTEC